MSILSRFLNVFRSKALEREFDEELRFHMERRIASSLERGMDPAQARAAAQEQFGDVVQTKETMREVRITSRGVVGGFGAGFVVGVVISGVAWRLYAPPALEPSVLYVGDPVYANLAQADTARPVVIEETKAKYTPEALRAKKAGTVKMGCVVQLTGTCSDIRVTRPLDPEGLDREAVKAAQAWRFRPAVRAGKPVPYYVTIEMTFNCTGCSPAEYKPLTINY